MSRLRPRTWNGPWLLLAACALQAYVLYWPAAGGPTLFAGSDKAVHVLIFALPVLVAGLGAGSARVVAVGMAAHAPLSELAQWRFISSRTGDPLDVVADIGGVLLALAVLRAAGRSRQPGLVN